jgi:hypothetical protein
VSHPCSTTWASRRRTSLQLCLGGLERYVAEPARVADRVERAEAVERGHGPEGAETARDVRGSEGGGETGDVHTFGDGIGHGGVRK